MLKDDDFREAYKECQFSLNEMAESVRIMD